MNFGIVCTDIRANLLQEFISTNAPDAGVFLLHDQKWLCWNKLAKRWDEAATHPDTLDVVFQHVQDNPDLHVPSGLTHHLWVKFTEPGNPPVHDKEIPIMPGFPRSVCPLTKDDLFELLAYADGRTSQLPSIARRLDRCPAYLFGLAALCQAHLVSSFLTATGAAGTEKTALERMGWTPRRAASTDAQSMVGQASHYAQRLRYGRGWLDLLGTEIFPLRDELQREWRARGKEGTPMPMEITLLVDELAASSGWVGTEVSAHAYLKLADVLEGWLR
jgi:hypothetical protein